MVERFNGRIAEVLAIRRYDSAQDLETTLLRYVWLYNHHLCQKALGRRCPMDAMKQWYAKRPDLFTKQPRNHPGPDISLYYSAKPSHGVYKPGCSIPNKSNTRPAVSVISSDSDLCG